MYSLNFLKNTRYASLVLILTLFCVLSWTQTTSAQSASGIVQASLEVSPKYPSPGDTVKARLSAPSLDKDSALITWTLNGEIIQQSYAGVEVSYEVGQVGSVSKLTVVAEDGKHVRVSTEYTFRVSDVNIIWEGRTYTPPFYRGKALQTADAEVVLVALPTVISPKGNVYDKDELFYSWFVNSSSIAKTSGKGKHSVVMQNEHPFEPFVVYVQIKDPQGEICAYKRFEIPMSQVQVRLYEDSPLVGIRHDKSIEGSYGVFDREATIVAEPFYMSTFTRVDPSLEYMWTIGGQEYTEPGNISLGSEGVGSGTTYLTLVIKNSKFWLQSARADLKINYGKNNAWGTDLNPETTPI